MIIENISFSYSQSCKESALFLVIAAFAGSKRFIRFFPGATKGGLLLSGAIAGAACALHDYKFQGKEFRLLRKITSIALGCLLSIGLTHSLKGRLSLSCSNHVRLYSLAGALLLTKNSCDYFFPHLLDNIEICLV